METTNQNNLDEIISQDTEKINNDEQTKSEIVYIEVEKLHPHDANPRKNVGDVTELADSIKKNGILQNLTVVPATGYWHGDYTVIIGHRRLAAAKQAGLKTVPCVIREMDQKEQIATMLLENMQRSDLTVYEQAQGMQMMLDLGETVETVAEKTGFSTTTVHRRVRLLKLDSDKFKVTEGRQIDITDYDKLFKIEDNETRNKLLADIGTSNFEWSLNRAIEDEKNKKCQSDVIRLLGKAVEIEETNNLKWVTSAKSESDVPELIADIKYYYKRGYNGYVSIYRDYTDDEKTKIDIDVQKKNAERKKRAEYENRFKDLFKQAFEMRKRFIQNFNDFRGKEEFIYQMIGMVVIKLNTSWKNEINEDMFNEIMGTDVETPFSFEKIGEQVKFDIKTMLVLAYSILDSEQENYCDFNFRYSKNLNLDNVYNYLLKLGYEMSDEEHAMMDGTHELYNANDV